MIVYWKWGNGLKENTMTIEVTLRDVLDDDLPIFFEHQSEPGANHMAAFMPRDPMDREAFDKHWAKIRADITVTLKTIIFDGHVTGNIGSFINMGEREVCYWIGKKYWGQGIATTALALFLMEFQVRPLFAGVAKDNLASIRVLEKCGFAIFKHQRTFATARGEEIDEVLMKLE